MDHPPAATLQPGLNEGRSRLFASPEMAIGLLFFAVSVLFIGTTRAGDGAALLWPGNALIAALLIRMREVRWIRAFSAVLVAGVIANRFGGGDSWELSAGFTLVNLFEIGAMVVMFRFVVRFPYPNVTIVQASIMTFFMGIVAPGISAVLGGVLLHRVSGMALLPTIRDWWMADALGACLVAPPVILYSKQALARLLSPRYVAANLALLAGCVLATWLSMRFVRFPFVMIAIAPMVAAFQVGSLGAAILSLCDGIAVVALWTMGIQPMGLDPAIQAISAGLPFLALIATVMPPIAVGLGTDARRQARRALLASEQRFRESMEHSPLGMIMLDLNGRWSFTNAAIQEMLGYSGEELADLSIESLAHPDEIPDVWERWGKLVSGKIESYMINRRFRHRSGKWVWTHCAVSLARDEDGVPMHFIAQVESLEERRRADARVAAERELLRTTLAAIGDAVITTDEAGAVTYMNDAAVALVGKTFEAIENESVAQVLSLTDAELVGPAEDLIGLSIRERRISKREEPVALTRPDGIVCYVLDCVTPVFDEEFQLTGLVILLHDVTEFRERTRALHHRANHDPLTDLLNRGAFERRLQQAFAKARRIGAPFALIAVDLDNFKRVNDTSGHAAGDEILRRVADAFRGALRPADVVGRMGGDEFFVLLTECELSQTREIAQRLLVALNSIRMDWNGVVHRTGASIGLANWSASFHSVKDWAEAADNACYQAKQSGRGALCTWPSAKRLVSSGT
jgi:diguanylate cyclase (GGDEF)-like protein/PAS domain S-box-containing protein